MILLHTTAGLAQAFSSLLSFRRRFYNNPTLYTPFPLFSYIHTESEQMKVLSVVFVVVVFVIICFGTGLGSFFLLAVPPRCGKTKL